MDNKTFWQNINTALDTIKATKPDTVAAVAAILNNSGTIEEGQAAGGAVAFFAGSGGDRTLWGALCAAGWVTVWDEADYYYVMQHRTTEDVLTYIEGDVYAGNTTGVRL